MRKHIFAILWKQVKDTWKNKTVFIQFFMFPVLTIVMENVISVQGMPEHFFVTLFGVMYIGMAPLTAMAAVISEEKEKNTLRVLQFSNVKFWEYLFGTGVYIWSICMLGSGIIGITGRYSLTGFGLFMLWMGIGIFISLVFGSIIGICSKNQMMATSLTIPVMLLFSFLPMLAMFHEGIGTVAEGIYTGQLHKLLQDVDSTVPQGGRLEIVIANLAAAVILFAYIYSNRQINGEWN